MRLVMSRLVLRKPVYPSDFRALFQALSRVAVASACGLGAGCSEPHSRSDQPDAPNRASEAAADEDADDQTLDAASQAMDDDASFLADADDVPMRADAGLSDAGKDDAAQAQDAGPPLPGPWVRLVCREYDLKSALSNVKFARPLEYLGVCQPFYLRDTAMGTAKFTLGESALVGSPCEGAADKAACNSALERERAAIVCKESEQPCPWVVLATSGDTVIRTQAGPELNALLGPVDSETKAVLVALMAGGSVDCSETTSFNGEPELITGTQVRAVADGYEVSTLLSCYGALSTGITMVKRTGDATILSKTAFCLGRRPAGLSPNAPCAAETELGGHFAEAARLEAASVFAFEQLARDLTQLGAPAQLIAFARRSAREEVAHTQAMRALAQRFGAELGPVEIAPPPSRNALAIALENAVEGCVRETYGALLACYQAETAQDDAVRMTMTDVFADETRHAQLAWEIAAWLEPQLSEAERELVVSARSAAYAELRAELDAALSPEARALIGMPSTAIAESLLAQLDQALALRAA